ncbi:hypothetical protein SH661x_000231 [Planctomicrobium sp. SH661]|uniref:hypothetical protein n=1 Tax=Planctomicrobium sp. SH661 TaxID=3448124 RepID=UPI003F5AF9F5
MSRERLNLSCLCFMLGCLLCISSCRSGGDTVKLEFSQDAPVWTDAVPVHLQETK